MEKELIEKFHQIEWLLRRHQHMHHHGRMLEPHRGQGRILDILQQKPCMSQKDLGVMMGIRAQSLGEMLSKLEKNQFIMRSPSSLDRRIMMVQLTETGRWEAEQQSIQEDEDLFTLDHEEAEQLDRLLGKVIDDLQQMSDKEQERFHEELHRRMRRSR